MQCGVVYNPFLNEFYSAAIGEGAYVNTTPISCSANAQLKSALVATGFPYERDTVPELTSRVRAVLTHGQDIRRLEPAH